MKFASHMLHFVWDHFLLSRLNLSWDSKCRENEGFFIWTWIRPKWDGKEEGYKK